VRQRDQLVLRRQHRLHRVEIDLAVGGEWRDVDLDRHPIAQQLPRHDVGMMLQLAQQDAIAGLQDCARPSSARRG
jgi:hypothetical protein